MRLRVYSDGASRGNPGPSAIAFIILSENDIELTKYSSLVGEKTNNQAEYMALIEALEFASELYGREVSCYVDSELVIKQLNGNYRIKNPQLKILWLKIQELAQKFQRVTFLHAHRTDTYIKQVDQLANQALDRLESQGKDK